MSSILHRFDLNETIDVPSKFTFPFLYEPHPLAVEAAEQLKIYLSGFKNWFYDLNLGPKNYQHPLGKMFGVLVVEDNQGKLGHLWAYSGIITGEQNHSQFVPLIFNMFSENSKYVKENSQLDIWNQKIDLLEKDIIYLKSKKQLQKLEKENELLLYNQRKKHSQHKAERKKQREEAVDCLTEIAYQKLLDLHQTQGMHAKFLLKEYQVYLDTKMAPLEKIISLHEGKVKEYKAARKELSNKLQNWIFEQYQFLNANGDSKNALQLFKNIPPYIPPSGTGDCAAPKLLQYAYLNDLKPVALAEFWYGEPLKSQIRKHGHYYPSCRSKCEPILEHMLQGLEVDDNPMLINPALGKELPIIYEDDYLMAVNKPEEFLSVRGKTIEDSVEYRMKQRFPQATGPLIVHRLDMSTSGILVLTKSLKVHKKLQEQFEKRSVKKRYVALLDGNVEEDTGFIDLALRVDLDNRPFQMVDPVHGKSARTKFEVLERKDGKTKVYFYPITGRTHQLRVHASHPLGLNCPIIGDDLYGFKKDRLYLHAEQLEFIHPVTLKPVIIHVPAPF
ncbi:RNA pseudouridine synthase [Nonlabens sp. MB-3u-79]|uniref:RluA family pseudouridine synthase n=1 Tax=Nonlabens sp. MB-3u-79 TaxID=2058134 RepID=UPI000C30835D|nr:RluA family pseudouridine synthase [Nonlabens sp. MB-3u-79]AUC80214.1 RNA pseudouridine synthase [Nonlabens sp. MB-3u-79]